MEIPPIAATGSSVWLTRLRRPSMPSGRPASDFESRLENRADSQVVDVARAGVADLACGTARETDQALLQYVSDRCQRCESVVVRSQMNAVTIVRSRCPPVVVEYQERIAFSGELA